MSTGGYLRPGEGWLKWLYAGVGVYSAALATTMLYFQSRQMLPPVREGAPRFDDLADVYDQQLGWDEFMMGLNWIRGWYVGMAYGRVLEVSAGTGRNFAFYKYEKIQDITITDNCYPMLREAKDKFEQWNNSRFFKVDVPVTFKLSDAESLCQLQDVSPGQPKSTGFMQWLDFGRRNQMEEEKEQNINKLSLATEMIALQQQQQFQVSEFDTVVDTFGLCSHANPVVALQQLQMVCKPQGRIILIEHGLSSWQWLNKKLNQDAEKHKHKWGCWWNRDIEKMVSQAGLIVEKKETYHFGSTHVYICRPGSWKSKQNYN